MSLSISPYNPSGYHSNVEMPTLPLDLIGKVIQHKQDLFNKSLSALNSYKNTALNINFLNEDRQEEVKALNNDLESKFASLNGEFGDLSDSKKFNNYLSWFDGFKNNTDLIQAYKIDNKWRGSLSNLSSIKNSKDPEKQGYSQINEYVFNHHLSKYIKSKKNEEVEFRDYTPYTNIVDETTKIYKSLPKKKTTNSTPNGQGYMIKTTVDGYTEDELLHVMQNMTQNQRQQFRIEAEYNQLIGLKSNPIEYRESLYNNYNSMVTDRVNYYKNKITTLENNVLLAKTEEEKQLFQQEIEKSKSFIEDLKSDNKSKDWFLKTNEDNLLNFATQLHTNKVLQGISKGLAAKPSVEYEVDHAYWNNKKLILDANQFNANLAFQQQKFLVEDKREQEKMELDKLALSLKYGKTEDSQNPSLFNSDGVSAVNPIKKGDIQSLWKVENDIASKSFNIADGANYGKSFISTTPKTNDQIIEDIVKLYDDNNVGGSTQKIMNFINQTDYKSNISVNTLVNALPTMIREYRNRGGQNDIKQMVGFVKTRTNQILEGNPEVLNGEYKQFANNSSVYQTQKQEEISFNRVKSEIYGDVMREKGFKNWNLLTPEQRENVQQSVTTQFAERGFIPSYVDINKSFSSLGATPNESNSALWKERDDLTLKINQTFLNNRKPIKPGVIKSYTYHEDGTVIVSLGTEKDFENVYGENYESQIDGSLVPNGTLTFQNKPLNRDNAIDRIIAQGSVYYDNFEKNGKNVSLKFSANRETFFLDIEVDGKSHRFTKTREQNISPRAAFMTLKNTVKNNL